MKSVIEKLRGRTRSSAYNLFLLILHYTDVHSTITYDYQSRLKAKLLKNFFVFRGEIMGHFFDKNTQIHLAPVLSFLR